MKRHFSRPRRAVVAAGALLVLAGCASLMPASPTRVKGDIQAVDSLNPSVSQRPSPLRLRIYELRADSVFAKADFMSLYEGDRALLAADLVARDEITLQPGEKRPYDKQLNPETRFVGVVAIYRDIDRATWRAIVPVRPNKTQALNIRADAVAISAVVQ
ncbi:MAG TPA: type VI secretion system lipoprotein TssJ [Roseateles sp.]|uniref:type VI secretion system lipoprotein TssJ n=1 Tax=Roseateles sp. TaxID=1971397 RepID=UPI002ED9F371